jgi:hypothetical protein
METELITSGSLVADHVPQGTARRTLVADAITAYLEQDHKTLNESILNEMLAAFKKAITRQLMQPRMNRTGYESTTSYTGPCARKARLQYDGVKGEPVQARSMLKFLLGDLVELAVVGIAQLAGVKLTDNNRDLTITGLDGMKINVHPDGLLRDGDEYWNVEIKSCDSRTYDKWLEQGGPDDAWGYKTQTSIEEVAWHEHGFPVRGTRFIAVSTGTRQGNVAEYELHMDEKLVDGWHERRALARGHDVPPVPFILDQETEYHSGKAIDAEAFVHGEAKPRVNAKGAIYGWDIPTGRSILPVICSYCAYKQSCHPGAAMEVKTGRPVWVVEAKE